LGVVFIPAMAGLGYHLPNDAMPWPGEPLEREVIRAARGTHLPNSALMRLAETFYVIHQASGRSDIIAYHPDTQGVFDIAHLLNGDRTFYKLTEPKQAGWIEELLEISLDLYAKATVHVKSLLNEPAGVMIHGHGTSQGVWFPAGGGADVRRHCPGSVPPLLAHLSGFECILPSLLTTQQVKTGTALS
jgi:hypothetical protein